MSNAKEELGSGRLYIAPQHIADRETPQDVFLRVADYDLRGVCVLGITHDGRLEMDGAGMTKKEIYAALCKALTLFADMLEGDRG